MSLTDAFPRNHKEEISQHFLFPISFHSFHAIFLDSLSILLQSNLEKSVCKCVCVCVCVCVTSVDGKLENVLHSFIV